MTSSLSGGEVRAGSQERAAEPCTMVIFGASGDLTRRKLVPALYNLLLDDLLPESFAVVGAARRSLTDPQFAEQLRAGIENIFPREERPKQLILDNVALSYVLLDGDDHAANRFYLEDLAIGLMRPPFNVDIER